jgi:Undecaprenyl-phosphate galactose phosphotransferase WbaP
MLALALGDALALTMAFLVAGWLRAWFFGSWLIPDWGGLILLGWVVSALAARLLPSWGIGVVGELRRLVLLLCLVFGSAAVILFLTKQATNTSRFTLTVSFLASIPLVPFGRMMVKKVLVALRSWGVQAVIYGGGKSGKAVIRALREEKSLGFMPTAVYDDDPKLWGGEVEGVPVAGGTLRNDAAVPVAILAIPSLPRERMIELLEGSLSSYKQVVIIPALFEIPTLWVKSRNLAGVLGLEITSNLIDPLSRFLKRSMDLFAVLVTAPLWVPIMLLIAAVIWLTDQHDPFFRQERIGWHGRRFEVLKFRTMLPEAELILQRCLAEDPALMREWNTNFKLRRDPRITRFGSFLRQTSLDEIPQLINVLRGEMSLVGPRPLPEYHHEELSARVQQLRTRVRPGMTGLWQISGRSTTGNDGMERWDAFYVRNGSIWLDIVILARTVKTVLQRTGAY